MDVDNVSPRRARGITLIEMITTLAVVSVSLAVVVPAWSGLADRSQVTATANQLLTHLRYARNEAVNRNAMVSLCPSEDGTRCSGDPRGWQRGYLVFVDRDGDRSRATDEPLLHVQGAPHGAMRLHSTAARPAIRFRPDGATWSTNTTFSICLGDDQDSYRAVILYGTGRARVDRRIPGGGAINCS